MGCGDRCVMTSGTTEMLLWCAGSSDTMDVSFFLSLLAILAKMLIKCKQVQVMIIIVIIMSLLLKNNLISASYALREHSSNNDTLFLHLDDVSCFGNESKLSECGHRGIGIANCIRGIDEAGVICTGRIYTVYYML